MDNHLSYYRIKKRNVENHKEFQKYLKIEENQTKNIEKNVEFIHYRIIIKKFPIFKQQGSFTNFLQITSE